MIKQGIAKFGERTGRLANMKFKEYEYKRHEFAKWDLDNESSYIIYNINIVDVDKGKLKKENAIKINVDRIEKLFMCENFDDIKSIEQSDKYINAGGRYLIPGLSDIHCHVANVSEYGMRVKDFYYHDAQRLKNCENAIMHGCTFVRNSGGAYDMVHQLKEEIDSGRLLGPKIMPSYEALTPVGGMWDINPIVNKMAPIIFGGKILNFLNDDKDILEHLNRMHELGSKSIKFYMEDKPLYGGNEYTFFEMFNEATISIIKRFADDNNLICETHAMYVKGARRAINSGINNIAHMTVDEPYSLTEAKKMVKNNVAIVPTLSIGCFLSMNFGSDSKDHADDVLFYQEMMRKHVSRQIEECTLPQMKHCSIKYFNFVLNEIPNRKMPEIGMVHKDRVLGFAKNAPESFKNFQSAKTKIGMGTDGGTGLTFPGCLSVEFEGYQRYGMTPPEILRSATLTNMEIIRMDKELGSIDCGKFADMIILDENPLNSIDAIRTIDKVFKDGKLVVDNSSLVG